MTEKLKTLMHDRATLAEFEMPDVDVLVRAGTQRARRRGLTMVGGAVAATVAAVIAVSALSGGPGGSSGPAIANDPLAVDAPSYGRGSVIHAGDDSVDVGHQVNAYVRTRVGYVVADPSGTVWSVAAGRVSRIGETSATHPHLVSDDEGPLAGWVDGTGERPEFVVFDQSTGETVRNDDATTSGMGVLADEADPAYFYDIDDRTAYWRDQRGAVAVDIDSGELSVVDKKARNGFDLLGVEDGVLAVLVRGQGGVALTGADRHLVLADAPGAPAHFSPDASWVSVDADEPMVFDVQTGERMPLRLDDAFATGYEWLDADTLVMLAASDPSGSFRLITCEIPAGSCEDAAADLGTEDELIADYALPNGEDISD
jgi:hypothetical protein